MHSGKKMTRFSSSDTFHQADKLKHPQVLVMNGSTSVYKLLKILLLQLMETYRSRGCASTMSTEHVCKHSVSARHVNQRRGVWFPHSSPKWNFPWEHSPRLVKMATGKPLRRGALSHKQALALPVS